MGPQGPQGPAGPSGDGGGLGAVEFLSTLNPMPPTTVSSFSTLTGFASCPAGKRAIAGGYESLGGAAQMVPVASHPSSETTWRVQLRNLTATSISNAQVRVYVVCAG